jgi:hypothetical protein
LTAAGAGDVDGAATTTVGLAVVTVAACCSPATADGYHGSATVATCCVSTAVAARSGSTAATACCISEAAAVPREPSLAAVAVLPATHDTLDERRLVGTDASDLSTLAGARGARWVPPCEREDKEVKLLPI